MTENGIGNGPDPKLFNWGVSDTAKQEAALSMPDDPVQIELRFAVTAWNLPLEGQMYADPDIRVRCYIHKGISATGVSWWCEVFVAAGVTSGVANPRADLFTHNREKIANVFEQSTGFKFPEHDVRLYTQGREWVAIPQAA